MADVRRVTYEQTALLGASLLASIAFFQSDLPTEYKIITYSFTLLVGLHTAWMQNLVQILNFRLTFHEGGIMPLQFTAGECDRFAASKKLRDSFLASPIHFIWNCNIINWGPRNKLDQKVVPVATSTIHIHHSFGYRYFLWLVNTFFVVWLYALPSFVALYASHNHCDRFGPFYFLGLVSLMQGLWLVWLCVTAYCHYRIVRPRMHEALCHHRCTHRESRTSEKRDHACDRVSFKDSRWTHADGEEVQDACRNSDFHDSFQLFQHMWTLLNRGHILNMSHRDIQYGKTE